MRDFYEFLKLKAADISSIDSLIQYLKINEFNLTDRYGFLINKEKSNFSELNDNNNIKPDAEKSQGELSSIILNINFSSNYYEFYNRYFEEENLEESFFYEDFDDWTQFLTGSNYIEERLNIEEKNKQIIDNITLKYNSKIYNYQDFGIRKYIFKIEIPVENFSIFFEDYKNSKYINWNDFFLNQNYFTASEVFKLAEDIIEFDKYIKVNKKWSSKDLLYKYCHKISNIDDVFGLQLEWDEKLVDFVIKKFINSDGNLEFIVDEGWRKQTINKTSFQENQIKIIDWHEFNLEKYYDFITESSSQGKKFVKSLYLSKKDWSFDLLKKYRKELDWWHLSEEGNFWNNEEILSEFKYDIDYDRLILNKNFVVNKKFILENHKKETNIELYLEWDFKYNYLSFKNIIKSGFPIDQEIFNCYKNENYDLSKDSSDELIYEFLSFGNLTSDLINYLSQNLDNKFRRYHYTYRRSGGDLDIETNWDESIYWYLLCKNPNILWDDYLILSFKDKLFFENLLKIKISYNTINQLFNYKKYHLWYHSSTYANSNNNSITSHFKSVLLKCEIYDLTSEIFLQNEIEWFGLWFNENEYNIHIFENLLLS